MRPIGKDVAVPAGPQTEISRPVTPSASSLELHADGVLLLFERLHPLAQMIFQAKVTARANGGEFLLDHAKLDAYIGQT